MLHEASCGSYKCTWYKNQRLRVSNINDASDLKKKKKEVHEIEISEK